MLTLRLAAFRTAAGSKALQVLPVFIAFSLDALLITAFQLKESAIALTLGVIAGGLSDMDHRASGRLKNYAGILACFALTALAVQTASRAGSLAVITLITLLGFCMTMLGAIDSRLRTISFCSLAVAVYTLLSSNPAMPWYQNPLMIIAGASLMQLSQFCFHLIFPNRPVQEALAAAYLALSDYMHIKARYFAPDEREQLPETEQELARQNRLVIDSFNTLRDVLFKRLGSGALPERSRRQLGDFFQAQDIHERITASHADYPALLTALEHSDLPFRIERLISLQARTCRQYAQALLHEQPYTAADWLSRADTGLKNAQHAAIEAGTALPAGTSRIINNLAAITARLTALGTPADTAQDTALANADISHRREIWPRLKAHLTPASMTYRHAVRMAAVSLISAFIAETLHLHLGYWILLTAVFIIQPNRAATQTKILQRIIGTILGVIAGSALPALAPDRITLLSLLVIANTLFFYFRSKNYSYSTFFITIQVFLSFTLAGIGTHAAAAGRIIDTLTGAAIAWAAALWIMPDSRYNSLPAKTQTALASAGTYLALIAQQLTTPAQDSIAYRSARRRVHETAGELASLASRPAQETAQTNYRLIGQLSVLASLRGTLPADSTAGRQLQTAAQHLADSLIAGSRPSLSKLPALPDTSPETAAIHSHLQKTAALAQTMHQQLNPEN